MRRFHGVFRFVNFQLANPCNRSQAVRSFSALPASDYDEKESSNSTESNNDFERRIFGDHVSGVDSRSNAFFNRFDRIEKDRERLGFGPKVDGNEKSNLLDGLDESLNTLSDGMDGKLKKAARYFEYDSEEIENDEFYAFRPDVTFRSGMTYDIKDLDLTKPGVRKPFKRAEFETTTEEVLRKADFRNVRFLANFITEAGVIIKRSKTKISAKAQRKVAREIKTARAFGLMPFTSMGTKQFIFGRTMEDLDEDYEYDVYETPSFVDEDREPTAP